MSTLLVRKDMVLVTLNVALASQVWARDVTKKDISMPFSRFSLSEGKDDLLRTGRKFRIEESLEQGSVEIDFHGLGGTD